MLQFGALLTSEAFICLFPQDMYLKGIKKNCFEANLLSWGAHLFYATHKLTPTTVFQQPHAVLSFNQWSVGWRTPPLLKSLIRGAPEVTWWACDECAAHLPQLVAERLRGVIWDGLDFALHPPLSDPLRTVQFQSNHGVGPPHQHVNPLTSPVLMPPHQHTTARTSTLAT